MTETDMLKGCLKNDRASQKYLYELYYSKMLGVCLRYSKNNDEAKDILHEGFLKVFHSLKTYNHQHSIEAWIKRMIVITAVEYLRGNKQNYLIVSTVHAQENQGHKEEIVTDEALSNISKEKLLTAIQELPPAYRTVLNLYLIDGFKYSEIAEILDISEETSKSNLAKAEFNLKKNLMHLIKK